MSTDLAAVEVISLGTALAIPAYSRVQSCSQPIGQQGTKVKFLNQKLFVVDVLFYKSCRLTWSLLGDPREEDDQNQPQS